jgi:adenylyltransferase/sulfurtransferase
VLGVLPGIIGSLQANEVIKLIVGAGDPLIGRLVLFDALKLKFRELKLRKNPDCPICSEHPTQTELIDYQQFCGIDPREDTVEKDFEMSVAELKKWRDEGREHILLDVRNPPEWEIGRIEGAQLIPLGELQDRLGEIDPAATIVAHCHHGARSAQAVRFLRQMGFSRAINLAGGIDAWSEEVDPSVPRY